MKLSCTSLFVFLLTKFLFATTAGSLAIANSSDIRTDTAIIVDQYQVVELQLVGKKYTATDNPVRDVELKSTWRHENGTTIQVYGFWDGDGKGGASGSVFKIRFCAVIPGKWTLVQVLSNDRLLNGQKVNYSVQCRASKRKGFWMPDPESPGKRWYKRSDGSHQYITGNTMYSFLSEYGKAKPSGGNISEDIIKNAVFFNKLRFSLGGDRYPHPTEKPFLNAQGKATDDGNFSFRPNPAWFHKRIDLAVTVALGRDMITDLILNGPDVPESRSVLKAGANQGDCTPYLKYIAARYGSFPNVWICLANEYDIREPKYEHEAIVRYGRAIRKYLPYPTPLSIHAHADDWHDQLNASPPWHDHVIIQYKLKLLNTSADMLTRNFLIGGGNLPIINDELAYEGAGDGWSEGDVIEAFLGSFMGGGYGSTGYKSAGSQGQYFTGKFDSSAHTAADNLLWFRKIIDENIRFWKMKPVNQASDIDSYIFRKTQPDFRAMAWDSNEYLLATNAYTGATITARLPVGKWLIRSYDLIVQKEEVLATAAQGDFNFISPDSRAVLFHFRRISD